MEGPSPSRSLPPAQSGQWGETGNLQPVVPGASPAGRCRQPPARSWAHRAAEHGGDQPHHPRATPGAAAAPGLCLSPPWGRAVLAEGSGNPRNGGEQLPQGTCTKCSSSLQALWGGRERAPKDEGMGTTCPGLSVAVATAEPRQHEMLLAKQPGDPAEEIGPFKRDSDK